MCWDLLNRGSTVRPLSLKLNFPNFEKYATKVINGDGGCRFLADYMRAYGSKVSSHLALFRPTESPIYATIVSVWLLCPIHTADTNATKLFCRVGGVNTIRN